MIIRVGCGVWCYPVGTGTDVMKLLWRKTDGPDFTHFIYISHDYSDVALTISVTFIMMWEVSVDVCFNF